MTSDNNGPSSYGFTRPLASHVMWITFTSAIEVALVSILFITSKTGAPRASWVDIKIEAHDSPFTAMVNIPFMAINDH